MLTVLLAGCRTGPVINFKNHPIAAIAGTPMESELVADGIMQAGNRLGWKMSKRGTNEIYAYIDHNDRQAVILISFSERAYSVKYLKSQNFLYDGQKIHKSYNKLVLNLIWGIDNELNTIANKELFEKGKIYIKKIPTPTADK